MVGFIQCSSDPSQPGRALDKKTSKIPHKKFGENLKDKIDICFFKNVCQQKGEVKKFDSHDF